MRLGILHFDVLRRPGILVCYVGIAIERCYIMFICLATTTVAVLVAYHGWTLTAQAMVVL